MQLARDLKKWCSLFYHWLMILKLFGLSSIIIIYQSAWVLCFNLLWVPKISSKTALTGLKFGCQHLSVCKFEFISIEVHVAIVSHDIKHNTFQVVCLAKGINSSNFCEVFEISSKRVKIVLPFSKLNVSQQQSILYYMSCKKVISLHFKSIRKTVKMTKIKTWYGTLMCSFSPTFTLTGFKRWRGRRIFASSATQQHKNNSTFSCWNKNLWWLSTKISSAVDYSSFKFLQAY